ncbi:MAG: TonB-dependent receptor [Ignavibacteriales bacterium]|nr:TonB-dependent receptor [Ignavibacteria bacterium]MBZ0196244.1 TonB-dependent receptor [Ignavibacteriaceae bacterium]MCZ2142819.1 TonB-dependent receptor [Ignavibacteriales bacterium]WKZ71418.1 MAG: TonB-dependent receptor [Ignavibacteriaceae bacterium]
MKNTGCKYLPVILLLFLIFNIDVTAQTAGKLAGKVTDETGQPLIGATVLVEGTNKGAVTDIDGYYTVLNLRAGTYTVEFRYTGYQTKKVSEVVISTDQTTKIDAQLQSTAFTTETVVVTADKPLVEFNQTSSVVNVSKDEIELLPVQDLSQIVNLQAGVVEGHFRGGRLGEVQYQVDGVSINNPFNNAATLLLDKSVLQEVQVISGTFDAKYGQAMSGVVNAVLRSGSDRFEFSGEFFGGSYFTTDNQRYPNVDKFRPLGIQNYQLTLSGPTGLPQTTFLVSGRRYHGDGYFYGTRRFQPTDKNDLENQVYNPTGDNELVPMNTSREWSGQFKLANTSLKNINISYQAIMNSIEAYYYNYGLRLNPDGNKPSNTLSLSHGIDFTHTLSSDMFYKVSVRQNYFDYTSYKYESVFDPGYIAAGEFKSDANYELGAIIQGVDLGRYLQKTNSIIAKADFTWQVNRSNLVEAGFEGQISDISFGSPGFLQPVVVNGVLTLVAKDKPTLITDPRVDQYFPKQYALYVQDRVELGDLVVRAGLRAEYYDANSVVPSDLGNPANSIPGAPTSVLNPTKVKFAVAPRLGFSFPLTAMSSVYFAYGHFYQMPGLSDLYSNSNYTILKDLQDGGISYGTMGNPDLKPQLTVQYEGGLKQAFNEIFGGELTVFYKDIRDLLGAEFVSTYAAASYPRLTNIDFGSVYGFTLSFEMRRMGPLTASLDYTMQYARGNASDPYETANRAAAGKDPRPRDIPFSWDQRHTLNFSTIWQIPNDYSVSVILRFGSGMPYTPAIGTGFNADLESNSGRKDGYVLLDLRAEKFFELSFVNLSIFARVTNLLNTHFVNGFVFANTGSPDYSVNMFADRAALLNPGRFYEPRKIEIGISFRSK